MDDDVKLGIIVLVSFVLFLIFLKLIMKIMIKYFDEIGTTETILLVIAGIAVVIFMIWLMIYMIRFEDPLQNELVIENKEALK